LRDAREADDDRTVLGRVKFPVLVVDGERLTLSVANPGFEWDLLESRYNSLDELLASSTPDDIDTDLLVDFRDKLTNHLDQKTLSGKANTTLETG